MVSVSISTTTRQATPRLPFREAAARILPSSYDLSLVFIGDARAQRLNKTYRNKTYYANVLTFPLSKTSGEIFINLSAAKREASRYDLSPSAFTLLLFIHGCLHLKGVPHGDTMEHLEKKILAAFIR